MPKVMRRTRLKLPYSAKGGNKIIINGIFRSCTYAIFFEAILFMGCPQFVGTAPQEQSSDCINAAAERTNAITALPSRSHLQTLDGQNVLLKPFFLACEAMSPLCALFEKFYYWENETKVVISNTPHGKVKHKIRCYYNCLSTCCPRMCDPLKTHGDVAEFYDEKGIFMGLAVYMGKGLYCPLPYRDYQR